LESTRATWVFTVSTPRYSSAAISAFERPANYRELVIDDGWSIDAYRTWLHSELLALTAPPPPDGPTDSA
jgi:hypothetical protein